MRRYVSIALYLLTFSLHAQLPKWVLGSSQQNSGGTFYTYGPGNLKFYEVNFKGSLSSTPRTLGTSIQNIKSVGTQDVMQTAVDTTTNTVLFYAFAAATGPWNNGFPPISPDTIYFTAYNATTGADEVFGMVPSTGWGASVIESELVQKPGSTTEYFFIYKTQATSTYLDYIRYVTVDVVNKTVSAPTNLVTAEKSGEGMAVSQLNCLDQRWLFVTRPESNGNITLRRCTISNSGITPATDTYTISIPGNSTSVVVGVEIAPTNNYLAVGNYNNTTVSKNMILFDYNNNTGSVSNERYYKNGLNYPFVTMEFSPNGSRVYILQGGSGSVPNVIYNCPVSSSNFTVTAANQLSSMTLNQSLTLETAYDGNIYVNPGQSSNLMYIINNPNSATPTITATASNFFGSTDRIGSGFPDQVDGDKYARGPVNVSVAASGTALCAGQTTTLTATSNATNYQWSGGSTSTSTVIVISPVSTSTYVMTVSNGTCSAKDSVVVSVTPTPTLSIVASSTSLCAGQSATLTANGASQYQWSGGSNASTPVIVVNPTTTTDYTLNGNTNGCSSTPISVTVSVSPTPTASVTTSNTVICPHQSTTLTASGGTSYQWSGGSTATTSLIVVSPDAGSTNYTVTVSDGTCSANAVATVSVSPTITLSPVAASICSGQSVTITAAGGTSYQWSGGSSATTSVITVSPANTATYVVSVTSGSCSASDSVTIQVSPSPTVIASGSQVICPGQTATLTASGGNSYQWSGGSTATTSLIAVTPTLTTTYSVTTTTGTCTSTPATLTVTVAPVPNVSVIANDTIICFGQTATITATGGGTYQWSGGSTSTNDTIFVSPTNTSTYVVTVTNGTCTAADSLSIQVLPSPTVTASGNLFICSGETTTLTASGAPSYQWSGGSTATTSVIVVSPTTTTDYSVTPINGSCQGVPFVLTVTVTLTPTVVASGTQTLCSGQSATLTASGASTYQWSGGITNTGDTVIVSPTGTTTYSVTSINGPCVSAPALVTVSVTPTPTLSVTAAPANICAGQSATLTASGATSYQWSGGSTATTSVIVVTPSGNATFTVTGANGSCAGDSATIALGVTPTPTVFVSPPQSICSGQATTITAGGASSYQWSGGSTATTPTIIVNPANTTTYTVTGSNGTCPGIPVSTTVSVTPTPTISVSGNQNICSGQSTTLTATGATSYQWSGGSSATTSVIVVSPASTTNYVVSGSSSGCNAAAVLVIVSVTPSPTVTVNGDQTICAGQTATLTAFGGTTYQWTGSASTGSLIAVAPGSTTSYTVNAVNGNCVSAPAVVSVTVIPTPVIGIVTTDSVLCTGRSATLTATGGTFYQWSGGSTSSSNIIIVNPSVTTSYTVSGTSGNCSGSANITLPVLPFVTAQFNYSFTECLPPTVNFTSGSAGTHYWDFGDGATSVAGAPAHTYSPGTYLALLITNAGTACADTSGHTISVVYFDHLIIPNIFTPNGDGLNDELIFTGLDPCIEYDLTIYNRWGKKVFETTTPQTTSWGGMIDGKAADDGTYFFMLEPHGGKPAIKGHITLIR